VGWRLEPVRVGAGGSRGCSEPRAWFRTRSRDERSNFGGRASRKAAGETGEREVVDGGGSDCVLAVGHLSSAVSARLRRSRSNPAGPWLVGQGSRSFRTRGNVEQVYRRRGVGRARGGEEGLASHLELRLAVVLEERSWTSGHN